MGRIGRRIRQSFRHDWLEIFLTGLGILFLAIAGFCVFAFVLIILNWSNASTPYWKFGPGALRTSKGFGLAVFGVGAVVFFFTGWGFAGEPIRRVFKGLSRRRSDRSK